LYGREGINFQMESDYNNMRLSPSIHKIHFINLDSFQTIIIPYIAIVPTTFNSDWNTYLTTIPKKLSTYSSTTKTPPTLDLSFN
jgi:hypothetical protein